MNIFSKIINKFLTFSRGKAEIFGSSEVLPSPIREVPASLDIVSTSSKPIVDSLVCPYCSSKNFFRRGFRQKVLERVQLYQCNSCGKTFTPQSIHGKHYPLATIFDAISLYNLGYSLEESCKKVNERTIAPLLHGYIANNETMKPFNNETASNSAETMKQSNNVTIQPSTLSAWLTEFKANLPFLRMRDFAMAKFKPNDMVITATLAHRQLYRFRFHRAKCAMIMQENFHHRIYAPLVEFLEMVPGECPHQYFQDGLRASEAPLTFSKIAMIVRGKQNFATELATFVVQGAKERKNRHEILQKFMLYNDSVTVATEVPVYITRDDMEHLKTQLGFQIFRREIPSSKSQIPNKSEIQNSNDQNKNVLNLKNSSLENYLEFGACDLELNQLPKLITGHIDILQIRNGQIHILDYKPNAEKERPIEQLTLYAMALSRLTGLRLFEFKCAWFDENDYFEFYPLHVLHKPKKARRRRTVATMEGTYQINRDVNKINTIHPTPYQI